MERLAARQGHLDVDGHKRVTLMASIKVRVAKRRLSALLQPGQPSGVMRSFPILYPVIRGLRDAYHSRL